METASLKINDDIFSSFDNHQSTILVSDKQSAAFDCTYHKKFVTRLESTFVVMEVNLTGSLLTWELDQRLCV